VNDDDLDAAAAAGAAALENSGITGEAIKRLSETTLGGDITEAALRRFSETTLGGGDITEAALKRFSETTLGGGDITEAALKRFSETTLGSSDITEGALNRVSQSAAGYSDVTEQALKRISETTLGGPGVTEGALKRIAETARNFDVTLSNATIAWLKQPLITDSALQQIAESTRQALRTLPDGSTGPGLSKMVANLSAMQAVTISVDLLRSPLLDDVKRSKAASRATVAALATAQDAVRVSGGAVAAALIEAAGIADEATARPDAVDKASGEKADASDALTNRQAELVAALYLIASLLEIAAWFREAKIDLAGAALFVNLAAAVITWVYVTGGATSSSVPPAAD
jgi:hypothetical protein